MERVWIKIIDNKANPLFWPALLVLLIISWFYRFGSMLKNFFRAKLIKTKAKVVSVGNLTVGGAGKTPVTIFLANYYLSKGKKVGVVSSGYGREAKSDICGKGGDIKQKSIAETGDELMEMAESLSDVYFSVSKSKTDAALSLENSHDVDIIIVDDGFQHRRLFRFLDILLIDAGLDLRNEAIFPLGRLRENLSAVKRADLILFTKSNFITGGNEFSKWIKTKFSDKPAIYLSFVNDSLVNDQDELPLESISSKNCYLFAGIGNFDGLLDYIKQVLPNLAGWRQFSDHCRYNEIDTDKIKKDLEKTQPEFIITTYKDYVKLRYFDFEKPIYYLKLRLQLNGETDAVYDKLNHIGEDL